MQNASISINHSREKETEKQSLKPYAFLPLLKKSSCNQSWKFVTLPNMFLEFLENIQKWRFWFQHFGKRSCSFFRRSTDKNENFVKNVRVQYIYIYMYCIYIIGLIGYIYTALLGHPVQIFLCFNLKNCLTNPSLNNF